MASNITAVFQKRAGALWLDVSADYDEDDDPALFEWLGAGGGGQGSFDIAPLAAQRGAPADFELVDGGTFHPVASVAVHAPSKRRLRAMVRNAASMKVCMGSEDIRWLHVDEILAATPPRMTRTIGIPIAFFRTWDGGTLPDRWDLLPIDWKQRPPREPGVYALSYEIADNTRYVAIERTFDFADEFRYFLDELRRLQALHGEVRIVYAFY